MQKSQQYYLGPKNINLDICDYIGIEYAFLDKDKLLIQPTNGDNDLSKVLRKSKKPKAKENKLKK